MTVKLQEIGLFHTPKDWDELMEWIERHDSASRAHVMTAAAMAWNMAARFTNPGEETE